MMGYGYNWGMMGGASIFGLLTWLIFLTDLILLGVWLWKQINKNH